MGNCCSGIKSSVFYLEIDLLNAQILQLSKCVSRLQISQVEEKFHHDYLNDIFRSFNFPVKFKMLFKKLSSVIAAGQQTFLSSTKNIQLSIIGKIH